MVPRAKIIPQWKRRARRLFKSDYPFNQTERDFINSIIRKETTPTPRQDDWIRDLLAKAGLPLNGM